MFKGDTEDYYAKGIIDYTLKSSIFNQTLADDTYLENGYLVIPTDDLERELTINVQDQVFDFHTIDYFSVDIKVDNNTLDNFKIRFCSSETDYYEFNLLSLSYTEELRLELATKVGNPTGVNCIRLFYSDNGTTTNIRIKNAKYNKVWGIGYTLGSENNLITNETGRCRVEVVADFGSSTTRKILIDDQTFTIDQPLCQVIDNEIRVGTDWNKLVYFQNIQKVIEKNTFTIGFDSDSQTSYYYKINQLYI